MDRKSKRSHEQAESSLNPPSKRSKVENLELVSVRFFVFLLLAPLKSSSPCLIRFHFISKNRIH